MCPFKPLSELVLKCDTGINLSQSCCGGVEPPLMEIFGCVDIFPGAAQSHGGAWLVNMARVLAWGGRMSSGCRQASGVTPCFHAQEETCCRKWFLLYQEIILLYIGEIYYQFKKTCWLESNHITYINWWGNFKLKLWEGLPNCKETNGLSDYLSINQVYL